MSHLPMRGEVLAAANVLNARMDVAVTTGDRAEVAINSRTGEVRGEKDALHAAYGDLFDAGELVHLGRGVMAQAILDIAEQDVPPDAAIRSVWLMATALGVLMERARWERQSLKAREHAGPGSTAFRAPEDTP